MLLTKPLFRLTLAFFIPILLRTQRASLLALATSPRVYHGALSALASRDDRDDDDDEDEHDDENAHEHDDDKEDGLGSHESRSGGLNTGTIIAIVVIIIAAILLFFAFCWWRKRRARRVLAAAHQQQLSTPAYPLESNGTGLARVWPSDSLHNGSSAFQPGASTTTQIFPVITHSTAVLGIDQKYGMDTKEPPPNYSETAR